MATLEFGRSAPRGSMTQGEEMLQRSFSSVSDFSGKGNPKSTETYRVFEKLQLEVNILAKGWTLRPQGLVGPFGFARNGV